MQIQLINVSCCEKAIRVWALETKERFLIGEELNVLIIVNFGWLGILINGNLQVSENIKVKYYKLVILNWSSHEKVKTEA